MQSNVNGISVPRQLPVRVTPREAECLQLAYLENQDIAVLLGISPETVKAHLANAYVKLGAANRTHAAMLWMERKYQQSAQQQNDAPLAPVVSIGGKAA